jgi:hypothetical protein
MTLRGICQLIRWIFARDLLETQADLEERRNLSDELDRIWVTLIEAGL